MIYVSKHICMLSCSVDPMDHSLPGSSVHVIFQALFFFGYFLLQGIFPTWDQTHLLCLLQVHWQAHSLPLCHLGSLWVYVHVYKVTSVVSDCLWPCWLLPARLLCLWNSPGKNTRVGCHAFLQGIFLTQGLKLCLLLSPALAGGFFTTSATWEGPICEYIYMDIVL